MPMRQILMQYGSFVFLQGPSEPVVSEEERQAAIEAFTSDVQKIPKPKDRKHPM